MLSILHFCDPQEMEYNSEDELELRVPPTQNKWMHLAQSAGWSQRSKSNNEKGLKVDTRADVPIELEP